MPTYSHDYTHCHQTRCTLKDKCYRFWLGLEIKNTDYKYASFYIPSADKELDDKCEIFLDIKNY